MGTPKLGPVVAIDGPAGTGKSSVTKRLCENLGYVHVDTGALYRALAYLLMDRGDWPLQLPKKLTEEQIQRATELGHQVYLEFRRIPELKPANRIFANGKDVTPSIRTPEVSMGASAVSAIPEVRSSLLGLQRKLGCVGRAILEGRDIGTVIFPDADVKFFLTASADERAKRRLLELQNAGAQAPSFEEVKAQLAKRDHDDSTRAVAPLKQAADAVAVDTTLLTLDQVVQKMEDIIRKKVG